MRWCTKKRATAHQTLNEIEAPRRDNRLAQLQSLRQLQTDVDVILFATRPPNEADMRDVMQRFSELWDSTSKLAEFTSAQIDSGLSRLQASTAETQRYLFWQSAGLILLTAAMVALFTLRLMRPIRQIDSAISLLGKGTFSKPINVSGPSDLVALGQQLEWLRTRLLDLAQERNRFLRHMSHELKTPLAAIREGTELLTDGAVGELDSSQRSGFDLARQQHSPSTVNENLLSFSAWSAPYGLNSAISFAADD